MFELYLGDAQRVNIRWPIAQPTRASAGTMGIRSSWRNTRTCSEACKTQVLVRHSIEAARSVLYRHFFGQNKTSI